MRALDFFSGCGGTSCGLNQAGIEILGGLDIDRDASESFRANLDGAAVIKHDICSLPTSAVAELIADRSRPIIFSGCAPCQPFSRQNRTHDEADPRRSLLSHFGRFVEAWRPDYVLVENVPGMQKVANRLGPLSEFMELLRRLGYDFDAGVVPALQYGVPQTRERFILLGGLKKGVRLPPATHGSSGLPVATVREWISGLPDLAAGGRDEHDHDHVAAKLSDLNRARIRATPEGGGRERWPASLRLKCHDGHKGHTDVYGRLAWDRPAAGLTTRCISYSNGRFGHPQQDRAISLREAACIQTFPRSFRFSGSLESRARQVGNAVPPLMAKAIGQAFIRHWKESA